MNDWFADVISDTLMDAVTTGTFDIAGNFAVSAIVMIVFFITYPLYMIGLNEISKKRNKSNSWMSFVPILNRYVVGNILGEIKIGNKKIKHLGFWLLLFTVVGYLPIPIPMIGKASSMIALFLYWVCIHRIYEIYKPTSADLYLIVGIVSECLTPILIYSIRNSNEVYSKIVIDDDGDGIYDREILTSEDNEERSLKEEQDQSGDEIQEEAETKEEADIKENGDVE